jgi:hypothetical protein
MMLNRTRFGRNAYGIGSSPEVARLSGSGLRANLYFAYGISGLIAGCRPDGAGAHGRADGRKHLQAIYNRSTGDSGCTVSAERRVPRARSLVHCIMTTIGTGGNLLGIDAFTLRLRSKRLLIFLFGSIGFEKGELLCKAIVAVDEASSSTGFCH